jgi:phosphatidylglycerol:prolipoprotein diacylglycerol transferase
VEFLGAVGWPILDRIRVGSFAISPHGIGIALGYLAGAWLMFREGPKRALRQEHMGTIVLWALVGAIVGARFFYVVGHLDEFDSFGDMLAIWRGGITLVGGILGAVFVAYPFMRKFGYRFRQVMDAAAPGLALGIIIGRIGDLVIGDHFGEPTNFFLGFRYEGGTLPGPWFERAPGQWVAQLPEGHTQFLSEAGASLVGPDGQVLAAGQAVHQTALYDFFIAIGLLLFLLWLNRKPRREGVLIASFAIVYGAGRVFTDFLRIDKTWPLGLTGSQWTSVAVIALSIGLLVSYVIRPLREHQELAEPEEREEEPALISSARPTTEFTPPAEPGGSGLPRDRESERLAEPASTLRDERPGDVPERSAGGGVGLGDDDRGPGV